METFPLNNLAGKFKVDHSTMVRAMRGVSPDEVARGKSRSLRVEGCAFGGQTWSRVD